MSLIEANPKEPGDMAATTSANQAKSLPKGSVRHPLTVEQVMEKLKNAGVEDVETVSGCVKAGIARGFIQLDSAADLDQVIVSEICEDAGITAEDCRHEIQTTLKMILHQPDFGGNEYEMDGDDGDFGANCPSCNAGYFVSNICEGDPTIDSGKSMNHCNECPNFGICIGDYRERHCSTCRGHYFGGSNIEFPCPKCKPKAWKKAMKEGF